MRKASLSKDHDEEPTTSGLNEEESREELINKTTQELIARTFSAVRNLRDKRELCLIRYFTNCMPEGSEEDNLAKASEANHKLNQIIEEQEQMRLHDLLESMLKNEKWNVSSLSELVPNLPPALLKDKIQTDEEKQTLQPIEINVDEPSTGIKEEPAHSVVSTGDGNVEKAAKIEAQVLQRVAELRRQGLWSQSQLPLCVDPPRNKTHWDYLLEEVKWMANDFKQERIFKRTMAKKLSAAISKQRKDQEMEVERAENRAIKDGRKICANIAKMVRDFWIGVDKMVDYKATKILENRKRRALDQHLSFIVGEADKLSNMVQEGLTQEKGGSKTPSISSKLDPDDKEFTMNEDEDDSDNESTLSKEEELEEDKDYKNELDTLQNDADGGLDDLLANLPPEYLATMGISLPERSTTNSPEEESTKDSEDSMKKEKEEEEDIQINDEGNGDGRGVLKDVDYAKLNSANADEREQELANIAEQASMFQPKGFTLETTQVKTQVPFLIRGNLREYQLVGLDWLVTLYEKNLNGILADEMGLGKTIQTISLLAHLACSESIWGPHLIVVPTSVILNWEMELKKWCPSFKILTYFGSVKERAEKRKGWSKPNAFHICITSYKTITTDIRSFKMKAWQYMILDEAQNIKNWKSQRWQALLNIRARRRLLLTGTPLQNSLMELWSLMHFLMPAIFASHDDFKDWFSNPLSGMMEGSVEYSAPLVARLHKILRPFILRRLKSEVEKQLPEKTESIIKCQLSKRQRYLYDDFMSRRSTKENLKTGNMFSVLNIVMQLRKCCNHPNLFEPRPVVSPFILTPMKRTLPAMIFDIVGENARQEESEKSIPQCLKLKLTGWANGLSRGQPTIQELKSYGSPILPPQLEGFRLSVPAISRPDSTAISPSVSLLDGISPAEAQRVGLNQNEQFLVIGEGQDERALTNGEVNNALKVRLQGEKFVVDKSSAPGLRPKICRVVVGHNGEKALIAVEKNPEPGHEPTVPEPSSANLPSSSSLSDKTVATQRWVQTVPPPGQVAATRSMSISSTRGQPTRRTITIHPSFKTHTQSYTRQLGVLTEVKGFNQVMANGGSRESVVDFDYKFSPPLKRRKIQEAPVVFGQYSAYVPRDFQERLVGERIRRLEIAHARFAFESQPIFPNHLISIFNKEMAKENSELLEMPNLDRQKEDNSAVLVNKFSLFVSSVQADAPVIAANTSGRSWMARQNENEVSLATRKCLKAAPPSVDAQLLASKIQFPELRLIEYDCGKLQTLAVLLRELYLYKHRCLIFTQMSRMLDILQAFLSHHGYQYFRLDGTTGIEQRQIMMERFNADPRIFCFILSTRSGGVGVNLTGADTVIFYDSDWNPTMDAQAQDRCHRIGQTRNVTIYRLISERTIEENILKKASQKKRLGEMAIDDAGFTPAWFKQTDSIRDLFDGDVTAADEIVEVPTDQKELESVMASLEDEQDVAASKLATAEAKADKAEFDEARRDTVARMPEDDIQDEEYLELVNQMKPVERYAIKFLEEEYKPDFDEEIKEAEAAIEQKKEDWVRSHQQAVLDDPLTEEDFYGCGSILDEVLACETLFPDNMMSWCPPTPPLSPSQANDIYYDDCLDLLYDPDFMGESKLPSTLYDLHRPLQRTPSPIKKPAPPASPKNKNKTVMDLLNAATMSQYSSASVSPMSTYDSTYYPDYGYGPTDFSHANFDYQPPMKKEKRERTGKEREMALKLNRETPRPITPPTPIYEQEDYEGPEWSIVEDMWIVDAINAEEAHGHMPIRLTYALLYNWDFVAQFVNSRNGPTGHFRSPRQCCIRYQMVVRPREAGHLHTVDPLTKKPRKVPVTQIELNHLKKGRSTTRAQFEHDFPQVMENQFTSKAKLFRDLMKKNKRPQKTYADVVPPVVQTQMPESFLQRLQELKIPITTILPEDMVRKQEEIHFNVFQENRAKAGEKVAEPEPLKAQSSISVRRSAIPSTGSVDSKAPFMLELPASRPPPPPRPPAQTLHQSSSIPTLIASDHTMSTSVPRRVGSVGGSMSHMVSPSSSTHTNYVVLNSNDHSTAATLRVQRATETVGAANNAMFRPLNSAPVRRTPPTTPLTPGHPRSLNYVTQTNQSNSTSYITGQQGGSSTTIYSGASPLSQGARNVSAAVPRVVTRPGQTSRIYVNNERSAYVHMTHPSTVRVVQGNAVQRVQPPKRVAPKPAGTTVTTMVVPAGSRPTTTGPQLQQFRTIRAVQRGGGPVQGRVMVMGRPAGSVNHVVTQGGVTRQLLTSRPIASRTGSPQTIAQVVLAPSNIQQQSSNQSQPQPPTSSQSGNVQQQQQQQQQASSLPPPLVAQTQLESQGAPPERSNSQSQ